MNPEDFILTLEDFQGKIMSIRPHFHAQNMRIKNSISCMMSGKHTIINENILMTQRAINPFISKKLIKFCIIA